jgi:propanol-preferring alcohol dehydrogenase
MVESSMRAMVLEEFGGPLVLSEIPIPRPGQGEVLVRVRACAVDRFDTAVRTQVRERANLPLILGHEISGEVAELGPGVEEWGPGDRVVTSLYLTCGRCRWCRRGRETICENFRGHVGVNVPGGYAEYTVLPFSSLVALPDSISHEAGSLLANVVGTSFHALARRMQLSAGEYLIITGAGGGVGLHAIQVGKLLGAQVMGVDLGDSKAAAMAAAGGDRTIEPTQRDMAEAAKEWTGGDGVDGVLELVGPATLSSSLGSLSKGGRLVIVGSHTGDSWTIDPGLVYRNEWEILGSRNVTVDELATVVSLTEQGLVRPIIDQVRPLADAEELQQRVLAGDVIGRDVLVP